MHRPVRLPTSHPHPERLASRTLMELSEKEHMGHPRTIRRIAVALAVLSGLLAPADALAGPVRPARVGHWKDVRPKLWARPAINFVARRHPWMRDYGGARFRPDRPETRKYLAHAMVMAFAPHEPMARRIHFRDLAKTDPFYPFADVAVKLHWMDRGHGNFRPDTPVTMTDVHIALVHALGLAKVAAGFSRIHTADGHHVSHR